jgi:hypothetical protein
VDTSAGFVYWQNPMPFDEQQMNNSIRSGQLMDIRLSLEKPERKTDSLPPILPSKN